MTKTANTEKCGIDGCTRVPPTKQGLAVHRARGHKKRSGEEEDTTESDAIATAERQHVEGEESPDTDEEGFVVEGTVCIDEEEQELIQAMAFIYGWNTDDEVLCAALADLLAWAREEPAITKAIELKRKAPTREPA